MIMKSLEAFCFLAIRTKVKTVFNYNYLPSYQCNIFKLNAGHKMGNKTFTKLCWFIGKKL